MQFVFKRSLPERVGDLQNKDYSFNSFDGGGVQLKDHGLVVPFVISLCPRLIQKLYFQNKKMLLIFVIIAATVGLQYYIWYWYIRCGDADNPCFYCLDFTDIPHSDLINHNFKPNIEYRTISLTYLDLNSTSQDLRKNAISHNQKIVDISLFPAVNGYDHDSTKNQFLETGIPYHQLRYETWGTLANFVAKFQILQYQVENRIEYMCFIEDDLLLLPEFPSFIEFSTQLFDESEDDPVNMIRLARWGEGYITNLPGAKRIISHMRQTGIVRNVDNQLRLHSGREICVDGTPFELLTATDSGDCKGTGPISEGDLEILRIKSARIEKSPMEHPLQPG